MPKIKLKSHLQGVEVGIGNKVNLRVEAGETVEVDEESLGALLSFGHFEEVDKPEAETTESSDQKPEAEPQEVSRDPMEEGE